MTLFDDLFQEAAFPVLLEQFGESIEYRPRSGRPRMVRAIVKRQPREPISEMQRTTSEVTTIDVPNSATHGIAAKHFTPGADSVVLPDPAGGDNQERTLLRIVTQTESTLRLELR